MKAIFEDDIAVSVGLTIPGIEVPDDIPFERLRLVGGKIIDAASMSKFWIDDSGCKHGKSGSGRQQLTCKFEDRLVKDTRGSKWRAIAPLEKEIKYECRARIYDVMDESTQRNLMGVALGLARQESAGTIKAADKAKLDLIERAQDWVRAMVDKRRELTANGDAGYKQDAKWPVVPPGLVDLVASL